MHMNEVGSPLEASLSGPRLAPPGPATPLCARSLVELALDVQEVVAGLVLRERFTQMKSVPVQ
jgi:hypothetical protein